MTTYPLIYKNISTGEKHKFRKINYQTFEREDGRIFKRNSLINRYEYIENKRTKEKMITTPSGFRVRMKV